MMLPLQPRRHSESFLRRRPKSFALVRHNKPLPSTAVTQAGPDVSSPKCKARQGSAAAPAINRLIPT